MSKKLIISGIGGLLVMVLSLGVGLYLVKNRQNIFPKANFEKSFMAPGPLMYFDPAQTSVIPTAGQTFSVKLMLNLSNENPSIGAPCLTIEGKTGCIGQPSPLKATSAEIHLKYPYNSVSFVGIVNSSDFPENLGKIVDSIEPGLLTFSVGTETTPKSGILTVATLNFKTKDNTGTKPMQVPEIQIIRPDTKVAGIDSNGVPQTGDILVNTTNASITFVNSIPGDIDGNGKVDIFDYNTLVSKFGNPYTIFDYNVLVANFGKGGSTQVFKESLSTGCRYQEVQCVKAPCEQIIVCEAGVEGNNVIPEGKIPPSGSGGSGQ